MPRQQEDTETTDHTNEVAAAEAQHIATLDPAEPTTRENESIVQDTVAIYVNRTDTSEEAAKRAPKTEAQHPRANNSAGHDP